MVNSTSIEIVNLTKQFDDVRAVSNLSFQVEPGTVTGFFGPNGAGKTTTLRILLGLIRPSRGWATFGGVEYRNLEHPIETVGAALEASSFHPGRSGRNHLGVYATAAGIAAKRVDRVLEMVGMSEYSNRRVGGYSLGMRQRLALAFALLGNPQVLVLDEPTNGLDPEGIRWMRSFLKAFAAEGKTVLISSHLLTEAAQTVEKVVIIAKGELLYQGDVAGLTQGSRVFVDSVDQLRLGRALPESVKTVSLESGELAITGLDAEQVGAIALQAGIVLKSLRTEQTGLENAFLSLVGSENDK
ncbi:MAG: ATP-binding cassette domain-containing protein [Microbacteriaceae bacterium]|nr:ATP-binding cassette domain-containing protein [Microbacteriaceae bacterium]